MIGLKRQAISNPSVYPKTTSLVVLLYNRRGTAEQHIKEGKYAFHLMWLACQTFRDNEVRLLLQARTYNLATSLSCFELPEVMAEWLLTSV